jgi:hypothetical protein
MVCGYASTGESQAVSDQGARLAQLTPKSSDKALVVDDYHWSDDRTRVLIYTNVEYVWREKSRGDCDIALQQQRRIVATGQP